MRMYAFALLPLCLALSACGSMGKHLEPIEFQATDDPIVGMQFEDTVDVCLLDELTSMLLETHDMYGLEQRNATLATFKEKGGCQELTGELTVVEVFESRTLQYPDGEREVKFVSLRRGREAQLWYALLEP